MNKCKCYSVLKAEFTRLVILLIPYYLSFSFCDIILRPLLSLCHPTKSFVIIHSLLSSNNYHLLLLVLLVLVFFLLCRWHRFLPEIPLKKAFDLIEVFNLGCICRCSYKHMGRQTHLPAKCAVYDLSTLCTFKNIRMIFLNVEYDMCNNTILNYKESMAEKYSWIYL